MYIIIGGDGKEYGPVSAEQVRGWIAGGRANLKTRVKAQGADEWRTVADFPELAGGGPAVAAGSAPARTLDILGCYERSWRLLKANFWPLVGVNFIMVVALALAGANTFGSIIAWPLFGGFFIAGQHYYFLLKIRGQPATLKDAFAGFTKAFVALLLADVVLSLFFSLGLVCLLLPGIYLIVAYSFTYVIAVDKGLGFWDAMETSRRVATGQWFRVFGLVLLAIPFMVLGAAALVVGLLVTMPLTTGAFVYAYEDLFNAKPAAPVTASAP